MAQKANLDLMESNARKADEEAKLIEEQRTGTELENIMKGYQNEIMNATKDNVIAISQKSLEEINLRVSNLEKEGRLTEANINLVNEQKANIVTDTLLKESNISVNDEVKKQIKANIINMKEQIKLGKMSIEQGYEGLRNQMLIAELNNKTGLSIAELNNKTNKEIQELANENKITVTPLS